MQSASDYWQMISIKNRTTGSRKTWFPTSLVFIYIYILIHDKPSSVKARMHKNMERYIYVAYLQNGFIVFNA